MASEDDRAPIHPLVPHEFAQHRILWRDYEYRKRRETEEASEREDRRRQLQAWFAIPGTVVGVITMLTLLFPYIVRAFK